ncbi:uncharacterized protein LOC134179699 [Corticium candelabrum]|uniref:uncharacterized protein LOC134179699 n=1 Tax=Corticium candelabrum TaxID=121492 RepID=UPI002E26FCBA|nr:uncharacterized protein LOC134179699 [Corticium candelabrum]
MKVIGLISGGKDSLFNLLHCVAQGHQIVAVANLYPPAGQDELDSLMYQTVGHEAVEWIGRALELPLYRRKIVGKSEESGRTYVYNSNDEVEDLAELLREAQIHSHFEGVAAGAIWSDYQRTRVENVCARLGLQCFSYLWHRDQSELMQEMLAVGMDAMVIKTAALGLEPRKHLGKTIRALAPLFSRLHSEFGFHVCGEGGEYETLVTDCPLFKKKIVIDSSEVVMHSDDAFAPVAYLKVKEIRLENKQHLSVDELETTLSLLRPQYACQHRNSDDTIIEQASSHMSSFIHFDISPHKFATTKSRLSGNGWFWLCGVTHSERRGTDDSTERKAKDALANLQDQIQVHSLTSSHIVLVYLYVRHMADFQTINQFYKNMFDINPPARVCVETCLSNDQVLMIDCLLHRHISDEACQGHETHLVTKKAMHVQSISHWAPANIGPYSQAVQLGEIVFAAGQIALIPASMVLVSDTIDSQAHLALTHVNSILNVHSTAHGHMTLQHVIQAVCFVTRHEHITTAQTQWQQLLRDMDDDNGTNSVEKDRVVTFIIIPALPKASLIEWHIIAHSRATDEFTGGSNTVDFDCSTIHSQWTCNREYTVGCLRLTLDTKLGRQDGECLEGEKLLGLLVDQSKNDLLQFGSWDCVEYATLFYSSVVCHQACPSQVQTCLESAFRNAHLPLPAVSIVPVVGFTSSSTAAILTCGVYGVTTSSEIT